MGKSNEVSDLLSYDFGAYIMFYAVGHGFNDVIEKREASPYNPYDLELSGGVRPPHAIQELKESSFPEQNFGIYLVNFYQPVKKDAQPRTILFSFHVNA